MKTTQNRSVKTDQRFFLKKKAIGISISESDNLSEMGLGKAHLKDVMIESARYILAGGGNLIYGGDMRKEGFTFLMFDLLQYYQNENKIPAERFINFLAWPFYLKLTKNIRLSVLNKVTFQEIQPPKDVAVLTLHKGIRKKSSEYIYIRARCLTVMRKKMEAACFARIFIGGKRLGYTGKCPGILEELMIAIEAKHPVFLIGGFGGVTAECVKAFDQEKTDFFSDKFHCDKNDAYAGFMSMYNSKMSDKIDFEDYYKFFSKLGYKGLSKLNGLSVDENKRLAVTNHIQEIIYLILKGLNKLTA